MNQQSDFEREGKHPPRVNPHQLRAVDSVDRVGTWPLLARLEQQELKWRQSFRKNSRNSITRAYLPKRPRRFGRRLRRLCCTIVRAMRRDIAD